MKSVILLLFSLAVLLIAGEFVLRGFVELPLPRPDPQVRYDPHPVRGFTLRPNQQSFSPTRNR